MKKKPFPFLSEPVLNVPVTEPTTPFIAYGAMSRELMRLRPDGSAIFAADLTLDEAKQIIEDLACLLNRMRIGTPPAPTGHINPDVRCYPGDEAPDT